MHILGSFLFKDIYSEHCRSPIDNSFKLAQHIIIVNRRLTLFQLFTLWSALSSGYILCLPILQTIYPDQTALGAV